MIMSIGYGVHLILSIYDRAAFVFAYQRVHHLSRFHLGTPNSIDMRFDLLRNLGMVVAFFVCNFHHELEFAHDLQSPTFTSFTRTPLGDASRCQGACIAIVTFD